MKPQAVSGGKHDIIIPLLPFSNTDDPGDVPCQSIRCQSIRCRCTRGGCTRATSSLSHLVQSLNLMFLLANSTYRFVVSFVLQRLARVHTAVRCCFDAMKRRCATAVSTGAGDQEPAAMLSTIGTARKVETLKSNRRVFGARGSQEEESGENVRLRLDNDEAVRSAESLRNRRVFRGQQVR